MLDKKLLGFFTQQHPQMALLTFTPLTNAFYKKLLNKMKQNLFNYLSTFLHSLQSSKLQIHLLSCPHCTK